MVAHDPIAVDETRRVLQLDFADAPALLERISFTSAKDPMDALAGADALIIVTEWKAYRSPNLERLKTLMKSPVIFDGRNLYEPAHHEGSRRHLPRHRPQQPLSRRAARAVFYAIPLESRPTWRNPPWMTVLLILREHAGVLGPAAQRRKGRGARRAFLRAAANCPSSSCRPS